jgi:hypothetical protein
MMKLLLTAAGCAFFGAAATAQASTFTVTFEQVGLNVVATGIGTIDTTGLTTIPPGVHSTGAFIVPAAGDIINGSPNGTNYDGYTGFTGPTSFGPGQLTGPSTGSGDIVGIDNGEFSPARLIVPAGYMSGSPLSDTGTYLNQTLAGLLVIPGTYTWTWDNGADNFILQIGPVTTTPLPAALPLFATGLGALGLLGWRRKRKVAATT